MGTVRVDNEDPVAVFNILPNQMLEKICFPPPVVPIT